MLLEPMHLSLSNWQFKRVCIELQLKQKQKSSSLNIFIHTPNTMHCYVFYTIHAVPFLFFYSLVKFSNMHRVVTVNEKSLPNISKSRLKAIWLNIISIVMYFENHTTVTYPSDFCNKLHLNTNFFVAANLWLITSFIVVCMLCVARAQNKV